MDYSEQLKDIRWKRKRFEILKRDRHTCQLCGYIGLRVNVHHKEYSGNAWDAPNELLITLCRDCHSKLHTDKWPVGKSIIGIIALWLNDL